jgi:alpha-beta hydrolase superfamily lysophospholipase
MGVGGEPLLYFLPGFMARPMNYQQLLSPLADNGIEVRVPDLRQGLRAVWSPRAVAAAQASEVAELVGIAIAEGREVWLAGHSRGGQVAWRAAGITTPDGLVLVDPVDGNGPRSKADATRNLAEFGISPVIIGAGVGGRCAPDNLNHRVFAAASANPRHLIVKDCGHADILNDSARLFGRRICGGGPNPEESRQTVTELMSLAVTSQLTPEKLPELVGEVSWEGPNQTY